MNLLPSPAVKCKPNRNSLHQQWQPDMFDFVLNAKNLWRASERPKAMAWSRKLMHLLMCCQEP